METSMTETTTAAAATRRPRRLLPVEPAPYYSAEDLAGHLAATAGIVPGSLDLAPGQAVDPYPEPAPVARGGRRKAKGAGGGGKPARRPPAAAKPKKKHEVNSRVRNLMVAGGWARVEHTEDHTAFERGGATVVTRTGAEWTLRRPGTADVAGKGAGALEAALAA
jgi:hypothetical protein